MVPEAHQVGAFLILFKAPLEGEGWGGGGVFGGYLGNLVPRALFPVFKVGLEISHPASKAREKRPGDEVGTWVNFCWVCAAGLSEPLPNYSLFCGLL